jgi:hypothetical protein
MLGLHVMLKCVNHLHVKVFRLTFHVVYILGFTFTLAWHVCTYF